MTRQYEPRRFFRNVPNRLLEQQLTARDVLAKNGLGMLPEIQIERIQEIYLKTSEKFRNQIAAIIQLENKRFEEHTRLNHNRFFLAGDHWMVRFNRQTKALKDSKGIRYIEYLLRNQGKAVHVSDLFYAINPPDGESGETQLGASGERLNELGLSISDLGDAGEAVDPAGNAMMTRHLEELTDRIAEARGLGDEDTQARLEAEQERVLVYLQAGLGLGGRPRKASSMVERVRKSVTKRIHADIDKIKIIFPELGHHLDCCIKTGTSCRYAPHPEVEWAF